MNINKICRIIYDTWGNKILQKYYMTHDRIHDTLGNKICRIKI